jgi:hypothetical protein
MRKCAAATALAIALNITMLTPAISAGCVIPSVRPGQLPRNEGECDIRGHGLRSYAFSCRCSVECSRKYQYNLTGHCRPGEPCCQKGFQDRLVYPGESHT